MINNRIFSTSNDVSSFRPTETWEAGKDSRGEPYLHQPLVQQYLVRSWHSTTLTPRLPHLLFPRIKIIPHAGLPKSLGLRAWRTCKPACLRVAGKWVEFRTLLLPRSQRSRALFWNVSNPRTTTTTTASHSVAILLLRQRTPVAQSLAE